MKPSIIVADTSPLIALAVMELLPVLPLLFNKILVPSTVAKECLDDLSKPRTADISDALSSQILTEQAGAAPCIQKLRGHGYHLSQSLVDFVLDKCQELHHNE